MFIRIRPLHIRATLISARYSSRNLSSPSSSPPREGHSAESYFKEVDHSPPADTSTYQVDGSSNEVQRPHKPPSGKFSEAGVGSEEYRTVDKQEPYDPPSDGESNKKLGTERD